MHIEFFLKSLTLSGIFGLQNAGPFGFQKRVKNHNMILRKVMVKLLINEANHDLHGPELWVKLLENLLDDGPGEFCQFLERMKTEVALKLQG